MKSLKLYVTIGYIFHAKISLAEGKMLDSNKMQVLGVMKLQKQEKNDRHMALFVCKISQIQLRKSI